MTSPTYVPEEMHNNDNNVLCRSPATATPPRSPSSPPVHGQTVKCELRRLNLIYHWERLLQRELLPPPPPPSSTLRGVATAVALGSVTKRSGRRRRRLRGGDFGGLAEGGRNLQLASWPSLDVCSTGAVGGDEESSSCSKQQ